MPSKKDLLALLSDDDDDEDDAVVKEIETPIVKKKVPVKQAQPQPKNPATKPPLNIKFI